MRRLQYARLAAETLPASESEWKKKLTPEQFYILRQKGTEQPYTGKLLNHKGDGFYACAGCGQKLYDSKTKYDSCGWPSFWDAIPGAVDKHPDLEATCSQVQRPPRPHLRRRPAAHRQTPLNQFPLAPVCGADGNQAGAASR